MWLWISRRLSKHQAIAIAIVWGGVFSLLMPVVSMGSVWLFFGLSLMKATAVGAVTVLANGMAADVIDIDSARTGEARTGIYFALWGMVNKAAIAVGVLVATNLPGILGYAVLPDSVVNAQLLLWIYALLPGIGFLVCVPMLLSWKLTRTRQANLQVAIGKRNARRERRISIVTH